MHYTPNCSHIKIAINELLYRQTSFPGFQLVEEYNEKIYEHPNFVWLDKSAVEEVLRRRRSGSCDPMVVYNNLLRW